MKMLRESFKKRFPGGGKTCLWILRFFSGEIDPRLLIVEEYMFVVLRQ